MAQLQYIGARYVPKYYENSVDPSSSEWEPGKVYEALIVVTYNDDSYISKIPVPSNIGDPASYPAYWAKSSFNAAAVAALQQEISDILNDIGNKTELTENESINNALLETNHIANAGLSIESYKVFSANQFEYYRLLADIADPSDESFSGLQSAFYDPSRNVFFMAVIASDNSKSCLATVDAEDPTTVISRRIYNDNSLMHANGGCYNSDLDYYVLRPTYNTAVTIDPSTLGVLNSYSIVYPFTPTSGEYIYALAYDSDKHLYYGIAINGIYELNSDFNATKYTAFNKRYVDCIIGAQTSDIDMQGASYYDGYIYFVWQLNISPTRKLFVAKCTPGGVIVSNAEYVISNRCEPEAITFRNGEMLSFNQFMKFSIVRLVYAPLVTTENLLNVFTGGKEIGASKDLDDDCYETGLYTYNRTESATTNHAPFEEDTSILSIPIGGKQYQFAFGVNNTGIMLAVREYNQGGRSWTEWQNAYIRNFARGATYTYNGIYAGYITASGKLRLFIDGLIFPTSAIAATAVVSASGTIHLCDGTTQSLTNATLDVYDRKSGVEMQSVVIDATHSNQPCVVYLSNMTITIPA